MSNQDRRSNYHHEIVELHQFFVDWFTGKLSHSESGFARFAEVIADGFTIISPQGVMTERDSLLKSLYNAYDQQPGIRIWIENVQLRHRDGNILVVTYEEWQAVNDKQTSRLSTVVFREKVDVPNDLEWLHVHETWMG